MGKDLIMADFQMNDDVKKYLQDKYSEQLGQINVGQAFANLGDVIAGQKVGTTNPFFSEQRKLAETQTLGEYEKEQERKYKVAQAQEALNMRLLTLAQQKQIADQNLEQRKSTDQLKNLIFQSNLEQKKSKEQEQKEKDVEKNLQSLSKSLGGTQDALAAIDNIEMVLGAPLEAFNKTKEGGLKKYGEPVDLPGVSLPLLGRTTFYNSEARDLASKAATVFNAVLKDRSGAAVTNSEMERLKMEFGQGKYNTEGELVDALKTYKMNLAKEMKNREAAFKPSVLEEYSSRGGRTSAAMPQPQQQMQQAAPETRSYQGKVWQLVGQDRNDPKSWKVVGE